jgi:sortase B
MTICFIGIISTTYLISKWKKDVITNNNIKESVDKFIDIDKEEDIGIDFDELRKINSDTVGYIEVPNTKVNYIVVKGKDNDYYLKHDFNKNENIAGWIFMDYKNKGDGTDKNIVIFGHNTSDESMFGSLSRLLNEDNIDDKNNLFINYITDKGRKKYQIFSIYTIKPEEYYITTDFKNDEFERFKEKVKDRSIYKININLENKNILTLSTCQNHGVKRLAIHAVEI